jgi:dipeptidyl aminopeptidase/acylaminoacyl peptidase
MNERSYTVERLIFKSAGHKLIAAIHKPSDMKELPPAVLVLHGFPGMAPILNDIVSSLCQSGFAPMTFHYRGCWGSGGDYSFLGAIRDTQKALDLLVDRGDLNINDLSIIGHSFGGLIAILMTTKNDIVKNVAALCPVANMKAELSSHRAKTILKKGLPFISGFPMSKAVMEWEILSKQYDPIFYVEKISPRPFLLIHGDKDDIIPLNCSKVLFSKAVDPKNMSIIFGTGHIFAGNHKKTIESIISWLHLNVK